MYDTKYITTKYTHLHWVYCRRCIQSRLATDHGSPTQICWDIRACNRQSSAQPAWSRLAASIHRWRAVWLSPSRNICDLNAINQIIKHKYPQNRLCRIYYYLPSILLTQPLDTCSMREMSHGLAPECANSTIFCRVESGSGRPFT